MSINYKKLQFFIDHIQTLQNKISRYLEIGGGHGLYLWEAEKILPQGTTYELVDISKTSIEIANVEGH